MNRGYALELVNPIGRRYRPAPPPDDPLVREARELARRDEEWSSEERIARFDTLRTQLRLQQEYDLARNPAKLEAPASLPSAIVELAIDTLLAAVAQSAGPRGSISVGFMVTMSRSGLRGDARRRAAHRLALTLDDAPRSVFPPLLTRYAASLALKLWPGFRRGLFASLPSWEFWLAVSVIRELLERQSWRQARRTSTGRPVSSD